MLERFIGVVEVLIQSHGMLGVFLSAFIEEVVAPIPSGLVMMSAGYAFLSGEPVTFANFIYLFTRVAIPLSLGLTLGSYLVYGLSYKYGENIIKRFGKYVGLSWSDVMRVHRKFDKTNKDDMTLLILRLLPIIPSIVINAVAGLVKFNLRSYTFITILGTLLRATLVSFIGWQVGNLYKEYAEQIDHYENYAFGVVLAFVVGYLLWKKYRKKKVLI